MTRTTIRRPKSPPEHDGGSGSFRLNLRRGRRCLSKVPPPDCSSRRAWGALVLLPRGTFDGGNGSERGSHGRAEGQSVRLAVLPGGGGARARYPDRRGRAG